MKRGLALAGALLAAGCSSSHGTAVATPGPDPLDVVPAAHATACGSLPRDVIRQVYGAPVTTVAVRKARPTQTLQTGCIVDVKGEKYTSLAVYLWHGKGFEKQWQDEVGLAGDAAFTEQPYGVEAYGGTTSFQTVLAVRERNFAVRLACGPTAAEPGKPLGVARCDEILAALGPALAS